MTNAHSGVWRYVADSWGERVYSIAQVMRMMDEFSPPELAVSLKTTDFVQMLNWLASYERTHAGAVTPAENIQCFLEPVNNRMFEIRMFSPLIPKIRETEYWVKPYCGCDVYARSDTGRIYAKGVSEMRWDRDGLINTNMIRERIRGAFA